MTCNCNNYNGHLVTCPVFWKIWKAPVSSLDLDDDSDERDDFMRGFVSAFECERDEELRNGY